MRARISYKDELWEVVLSFVKTDLLVASKVSFFKVIFCFLSRSDSFSLSEDYEEDELDEDELLLSEDYDLLLFFSLDLLLSSLSMY